MLLAPAFGVPPHQGIAVVQTFGGGHRTHRRFRWTGSDLDTGASRSPSHEFGDATMIRLAIGLGLRSATSVDAILSAVQQVRDEYEISCLATIDRRATDPALQAAATHLGVPIISYTATELATVPVPTPSPRVHAATGTPSVAEAAALLATNGGPLLQSKRTISGVVVATAHARHPADWHLRG